MSQYGEREATQCKPLKKALSAWVWSRDTCLSHLFHIRHMMSQLRMRCASPILEYFPDESSNTIINGRFWSVACITIHLPASLMKPVFCTPISHALLAVSALVLW